MEYEMEKENIREDIFKWLVGEDWEFDKEEILNDFTELENLGEDPFSYMLGKNMKYQVFFKKEGAVTVEADSADEARMLVEEMSDCELSNNFFSNIEIEDWEEIEDEEN